MSQMLLVLSLLLSHLSEDHACNIITCKTNEPCVVDFVTEYYPTHCPDSTIIGTNASSLIVNCNGSDLFRTCQHINIHCPENIDDTSICRINCNYRQCYHATVYYPQPQNLFINCYAEISCIGLQLIGPSTYSTKQQLMPTTTATIICAGTSFGQCYQASFDLNYITNINIKCSSIDDPIVSDYYGACGYIKIYAKWSSNMNISCGNQDCYQNYIDAEFLANQLTINCNNCGATGDGQEVVATHANHIAVNCDGCKDFQLYANNATKVVMKCQGTLTFVQIYAMYVTEFEWQCIGAYACSYSSQFNYIDVSYANKVNIIAYGDHSIEQAIIFASHANELNLFSYANQTDIDTLRYLILHAPSYPKKSVWNCYGTGCNFIQSNSNNGFDDVDVNINGCGICNDVSSCVGAWTTHCQSLHNASISVSSTLYGNKCYDTNCHCLGQVQQLAQIFVNDASLCKQLLHAQPTSFPTINPTITQPTMTNIPTTSQPTRNSISTSVPTMSGIWSKWTYLSNGNLHDYFGVVQSINENSYVTRICVRSGDYHIIDIQVSFNDNTSSGTSGFGGEYQCYSVNKGECFSEITATSQVYIGSLQFRTSDNMVSPLFGGQSGYSYNASYGNNYCLSKMDIYIWSAHIDQMRFYFIQRFATTQSPAIETTISTLTISTTAYATSYSTANSTTYSTTSQGKSENNGEHKSQITIYIIVSVCAFMGILFVACIIVGIYSKMKRNKSKMELYAKESVELSEKQLKDNGGKKKYSALKETLTTTND